MLLWLHNRSKTLKFPQKESSEMQYYVNIENMIERIIGQGKSTVDEMIGEVNALIARGEVDYEPVDDLTGVNDALYHFVAIDIFDSLKSGSGFDNATVTFGEVCDENDNVVFKDMKMVVLGLGKDAEGHSVYSTAIGVVTILP